MPVRSFIRGILRRLPEPLRKPIVRHGEHKIERAFSKGVAERLEVSKTLTERYFTETDKYDPNIIIIVVDALRFRNVSFSGYRRKTTPFLDSASVRLRAFAAAPHTFPSVASILTGHYPHVHGGYIHDEVKNFDTPQRFGVVHPRLLTLPEILHTLGYKTLFITYMTTALVAIRGRVAPLVRQEIAHRILTMAAKRLKEYARTGAPVFAYIHLGDLHEPLTVPPRPFRSYFGDPGDVRELRGWKYERPEEQRGPEFENYRFRRMLLYDNSLRYVDKSIEEFYSTIESFLKPEDTVLIITADHGEEFWEHADMEAKYFYDPRGYAGIGHGHNVFNEIIEVPLVAFGPIPRPSADRPTSLVDIAPSILELLGLRPRPPYFLGGTPIWSKEPMDRPLLSEAAGYGYEKKALVTASRKLLFSQGDNVKWLFHLDVDPEERSPLSTGRDLEDALSLLKRMLARGLLRLSRLAGRRGAGSGPWIAPGTPARTHG